MRKSGLFLAVALVFFLGSCSRLHAQSGTTAQNGRRLTCASDDGRRHLCPVNTQGGVRMINQRSGSPCIQGSTWGFDRRGIWVDRGCRADFIVGIMRPPVGPPLMTTLTCSSNNGRRNYCRANTSGGVRMIQQRSGAPCVQGSTWGFDRGGIWVDRGCRADFALNVRR